MDVGGDEWVKVLHIFTGVIQSHNGFMKNFLLLCLTLTTLIISTTSQQHDSHKTLYWPSGSGAPYQKLSFSSESCSCQKNLNLTKSGCFNITDGLITPPQCIDKPYWGLVFVWWGVAAFLIGGATTTSFGLISDICKTLWLFGRGHKNPTSNQVVDVNWKNERT
jgi:hypothetical protein